jgi:hypothetical protein
MAPIVLLESHSFADNKRATPESSGTGMIRPGEVTGQNEVINPMQAMRRKSEPQPNV